MEAQKIVDGILRGVLQNKPRRSFIGLQRLLLALREQHEELLKHMAEGLGIGTAELSAYESGRKPFPEWLPEEIAKIYKLPLSMVVEAATETRLFADRGPDPGLGPQLRDIDDETGAFDVLNEHYRKQRT